MHFRNLVCLIAYLVAAPAFAAVTITGFESGVPTPGLPGYETITLMAVSDAGDIWGFDFADSGSIPYGLFGMSSGSLNQLAPMGMPTIWNDVDPATYAAEGMNHLADTHFLLGSLDGAGEFGGPGSFGSESTLHLKGYIENLEVRSSTMPFAQIVKRVGEPLWYTGSFFMSGGVSPRGEFVSGVYFPVPEPSSIALAAFGLLGVAAYRGRR